MDHWFDSHVAARLDDSILKLAAKQCGVKLVLASEVEIEQGALELEEITGASGWIGYWENEDGMRYWCHPEGRFSYPSDAPTAIKMKLACQAILAVQVLEEFTGPTSKQIAWEGGGFRVHVYKPFPNAVLSLYVKEECTSAKGHKDLCDHMEAFKNRILPKGEYNWQTEYGDVPTTHMILKS